MVDYQSAIERIELTGDYDLSRRDEIRAVFDRVDGKCPVVLDVRSVTYADSSFLHELARLKMSHSNCTMLIYGANPMLKKLLHLLAFDKLFTIADPE